VQGLNPQLRLSLPAPLQAFLENGSSRCDIHFLWDPPKNLVPIAQSLFARGGHIFGGTCLCDAARLVQWQEWCREGAEETWIADEPREREFWLNSAPFAFMSNGDFLALDVRGKPEDPPVVYLCHDGMSFQLTVSFDEFRGVGATLLHRPRLLRV
jgi:hypothetical protein